MKQLEFTPETIKYIESFSQSVKNLQEIIYHKTYIDLIKSDIDKIIDRLEDLEEEKEMPKQCLWCKKVLDEKKKTWEVIGAIIPPDVTTKICPSCLRIQYKEYCQKQLKKIQADVENETISEEDLKEVISFLRRVA